jgi:tetratricopeptide (TPR) repeat protein
MKKVYLILFLTHFSSFANNCNNSVKEIYENIILSIGNNSLYPPELHFSDETSRVAYMSSKGITIEQKTIDLFCGKDNFEDKIGYIIAHELAHYYLEHSWMSNTGLSYASSIGEFVEDSSSLYSAKQKKLSESQADLYAGFYGQIAGYNTLGFGEEALTAVYESYSLPKELNGYPSFDERIDILNSRRNKANDLALLFELGNVLLLSKQYNLAKECYETILKNKFNSREIYNNLGLSYLLYGISIYEEDVANLLYPVYIDQQTRAEITTTRSASLFDSPKKMILEAQKLFNRALALDTSYEPAKKNLIVSDFLLETTPKGRSNFVKSLEASNIDSEFITDFKVINAVIEKRKPKKINKLALKGSYISRLNASNYNSTQVSIISSDQVLKRLNIDLMELLMGSGGKKIKGTHYNVKMIGKIRVIEGKKITVFKIPKKLVEDSFTAQEQAVFYTTAKGVYYVYIN